MFEADGVDDYELFFHISPYRRSKETAVGIARAFDPKRLAGVREEPQLREQDFGNFQDLKAKQQEKRERQSFGRFFYRFPDGESGADVFDRITMFEDHLVRDIDAGRFSENTNLILCTHGLTLRLFLAMVSLDGGGVRAHRQPREQHPDHPGAHRGTQGEPEAVSH